MSHRRQLAQVIEKVFETEDEISVDADLMNDYKQLNEKCDDVISKIKDRKKKKDLPSTKQ